MSNARDNIKANLASEAQYVAKVTRIDLDAFLALTGEARAARWRQWDRTSKMDAVIQAFDRQRVDWQAADVDAQIAKYDQKYAAGPVDAAIEGALERLAIDNGQHAQTTESSTDRAFFRRAATAYTNALVEYRNGVRPQRLEGGAWLLPSRRPGEAPHLVAMDGDWTCNCKAGASMHWPIALVIGIEVAHDDMQRFDDPSSEPTPAELGRRIAEARRSFLEAA